MPRNIPQRQLTQVVSAPAPTAGIDAITPGAQMAPDAAIYLYNLLPAELGAQVRDGYTRHSTGMGAPGLTVIPAGDKLFSTTTAGIWDVTSDTATLAVAFPDTTGAAGQGVSISVVTLAGSFTLYTDERNGYYLYTQSTDTWAKIAQGTSPGEIDGADPGLFAHVSQWKSRVFFVERGTGHAWYLDVGQLTGTVARLDFGNRFVHGGELVCLAPWTLDGGAGVDDYLVAVSREGDVLVYKGTDPADASAFDAKGSWYVGPIPAGRRVVSDLGGDLLLLSTRGLTALSQLVAGRPPAEDAYGSKRILRLLRLDLAARGSTFGWGLHYAPRQNLLFVSVPRTGSKAYVQYALFVPKGTWGICRGLPMHSANAWGSDLYMGDQEGNIWSHSGNLDASAAGSTGTPVEFSMLSSFQQFGAPGRVKRIHFVRPLFVSDSSTPSYRVQLRYEYNKLEASAPPPMLTPDHGIWDLSQWDAAVWADDHGVIVGDAVGASGMGRHVAIAMRGLATSKTTLIGFDVAFDVGGML